MEKNYANTIRQLSEQYYHQDISKQEYINKRKKIIDLMEDEFNGHNYSLLPTLIDTHIPSNN